MHRPGIPAPRIILASSSPFRQALLRRLAIDFTVVAPEVDETPQHGEQYDALALRLAEAKARSVGTAFPGSLAIGSDQIAVLGTTLVGKPGGYDTAVAQLLAASGRTMRFLTAVCLFNSASGRCQIDVVPTTVTLRAVDRPTIEAYVQREQPYGCAGAFMAEGLGIALMEKLESDDPTALIGLPLVCLNRMLREEGIDVLQGKGNAAD